MTRGNGEKSMLGAVNQDESGRKARERRKEFLYPLVTTKT